MSRRAVFLDRDGTLVHPRHYPSRPEELILYDDVGPALHQVQAAGFLLIVITNQAGLARGYFSVAALDQMHDHLRAQLALWAVRLAGIYYCPHHPEGQLPDLALVCTCRKPQPGMLLRAAAEHDLDLAQSWFIGDILDDIEAGNRAGCQTVLVDLGTESAPALAIRTPTHIARDTCHALALVAAAAGLSQPVVPDYQPARWTTDSAARPAQSREYAR